MKAALRFLLGVLLLSGADVFALPSPPHQTEGAVAAIGREKITLAPAPLKKDNPTSFAIQAGRTRFRNDGRRAAAEQLPVGQGVRLYYKKELGEWVATEIMWKTGRLPGK